MKEAESLALWTAEFERPDRRKVDKHIDGELIDNAIMNPFVPHEESSVRPHEDFMTRSEFKKLMDDNIKTLWSRYETLC